MLIYSYTAGASSDQKHIGFLLTLTFTQTQCTYQHDALLVLFSHEKYCEEFHEVKNLQCYPTSLMSDTCTLTCCLLSFLCFMAKQHTG